jgi:hypothetical protein
MKHLLSLLLLLLCSAPLGRAEEQHGFRRIFNGTDLTEWDGDPRFWSVSDGVLRGESNFNQPAFTNTFLIWRGGKVKDFELHLKFRLTNGNSGVQYRSKDLGKWVVGGYQAEIDNQARKTGFLYEERGRKFLVNLGERLQTNSQGGKHLLGVLATQEEYSAWNYYHPQDWNDYIICAKGTYIAHYVNGFQTIELTDDDRARNALEGILALQLHAGLPMVVEFKDIFLKAL